MALALLVGKVVFVRRVGCHLYAVEDLDMDIYIYRSCLQEKQNIEYGGKREI